MPPRRRTVPTGSLTAEHLATLADGVAAGKRTTVYLIDGIPSLGLPPGTSARVVSVDGTTVVVRPRGVDDELPHDADELRLTKNPPAPAKAAPTKTAATKATPKKAAPTKAAPSKAAPTAGAPTVAAPEKTALEKTAPQKTTPARSTPARSTPARSTPTRRTPAAAKSVTLTVYGSPDNQWSVALTRGARKPQRSRPVTPEAVDAAVRELGDPAAAEAVTGLLRAAREEAARRVAELSAELEAARQALAALDRD